MVSTPAPVVSTTTTNVSTTVNTTSVNSTKTVTTPAVTNLGNIVETVTVYFGSASDVVPTAEREKLSKVLALLKENGNYKALIKGYTDKVGDTSANVELSLKRATTVWQYLNNNGMEGDRGVLYGYGEMAQEAKTDQGNRRVVVEIVK